MPTADHHLPHDLTERLYRNALVWIMEETLSSARHHHGDPSQDVLTVLASLAVNDRSTYGPLIMRAAIRTAWEAVPGCLPPALPPGQPVGEADLRVDLMVNVGEETLPLSQAVARFPELPLQELDQRLRHAGALLMALAHDDEAEITRQLDRATDAPAAARVWGDTLYLICTDMLSHDPHYRARPGQVRMRCPGCSTVIAARHTPHCPHARCAHTGVRWMVCVKTPCEATYWEGEPTGSHSARQRRLWCVDTPHGPMECAEHDPFRRPWAEEMERIGTWDPHALTWT